MRFSVHFRQSHTTCWLRGAEWKAASGNATGGALSRTGCDLLRQVTLWPEKQSGPPPHPFGFWWWHLNVLRDVSHSLSNLCAGKEVGLRACVSVCISCSSYRLLSLASDRAGVMTNQMRRMLRALRRIHASVNTLWQTHYCNVARELCTG